jgi:hypothetical protein
MYSFYRFRRTAPLPLVLKSNVAVPHPIDVRDWVFSFERTPEETNEDVRGETDAHGYCLIETNCTFDALASELEQRSAIDAEASGDPQPAARASDDYHFFVHRALKRWRLALRSVDRVADLTRMDDWRFSRTRKAKDTAVAVQREIAERGYSLFKIGGTVEQLVGEVLKTD